MCRSLMMNRAVTNLLCPHSLTQPVRSLPVLMSTETIRYQVQRQPRPWPSSSLWHSLLPTTYPGPHWMTCCGLLTPFSGQSKHCCLQASIFSESYGRSTLTSAHSVTITVMRVAASRRRLQVTGCTAITVKQQRVRRKRTTRDDSSQYSTSRSKFGTSYRKQKTPSEKI